MHALWALEKPLQLGWPSRAWTGGKARELPLGVSIGSVGPLFCVFLNLSKRQDHTWASAVAMKEQQDQCGEQLCRTHFHGSAGELSSLLSRWQEQEFSLRDFEQPGFGDVFVSSLFKQV